MRRIFLCLLTILAGTSIGAAGDYTYNASDGYWYYDGVPYQRYYTPGYWRYGCYYNGYYSYQAVKVVYANPVPEYTPHSDAWKKKIIEYAEERDNHKAYLDALNVVGLHGQTYDFQSGYGAYSSTYAPNATTQYGLGVAGLTSLLQLYGENQDGVLFQQASQLQSDAQTNTAQGYANLLNAMNTKMTLSARIAEVLARGEVAQRVITALAAPGGIETRSFTFTVNNGQIARDDSRVTPEQKAQLFGQWKTLAQNRCAACHSGATKKGGLDILNDYPKMDPAHKQAVWARLTTDDLAKRMPRDPRDASKPGAPLNSDEQKLFFLN